MIDFNNQIKAYANDDNRQGLADVVTFILSLTLAAREVDSSGKINMGPYHVMWAAAMNIIPAINEMDACIADFDDESLEDFAEIIRNKMPYPVFTNAELIQAFKVAIELNKLIMKDTE